MWDLSSLTRDQSCAPCGGSRVPNKVLFFPFLPFISFPYFSLQKNMEYEW